MMDQVTSVSRSGLRDWLIQRVSALIILIYSIVLVVSVLSADRLTYQFWHDLYQHPAMRVLSLLAVFSIVFHAWIGLWTVYTDYVKWFFLRLFLQILTVVGLFALLAWTFKIM